MSCKYHCQALSVATASTVWEAVLELGFACCCRCSEHYWSTTWYSDLACSCCWFWQSWLCPSARHGLCSLQGEKAPTCHAGNPKKLTTAVTMPGALSTSRSKLHHQRHQLAEVSWNQGVALCRLAFLLALLMLLERCRQTEVMARPMPAGGF